MAEFYGTLQGNRGVASRCGSKQSGIQAMLKSWGNKADISLQRVDEKDVLTISCSTDMKVIINGKEYKGDSNA